MEYLWPKQFKMILTVMRCASSLLYWQLIFLYRSLMTQNNDSRTINIAGIQYSIPYVQAERLRSTNTQFIQLNLSIRKILSWYVASVALDSNFIGQISRSFECPSVRERLSTTLP